MSIKIPVGNNHTTDSHIMDNGDEYRSGGAFNNDQTNASSVAISINEVESRNMTKQTSLVIIKITIGSPLESKPCFYYNNLPSVHYYLAEDNNSNAFAEVCENKHVFSRISCFSEEVIGVMLEVFNFFVDHKIKI